jgi:hypothetical protein
MKIGMTMTNVIRKYGYSEGRFLRCDDTTWEFNNEQNEHITERSKHFFFSGMVTNSDTGGRAV